MQTAKKLMEISSQKIKFFQHDKRKTMNHLDRRFEDLYKFIKIYFFNYFCSTLENKMKTLAKTLDGLYLQIFCFTFVFFSLSFNFRIISLEN